jgi:hypothetical protein
LSLHLILVDLNEIGALLTGLAISIIRIEQQEIVVGVTSSTSRRKSRITKHQRVIEALAAVEEAIELSSTVG